MSEKQAQQTGQFLEIKNTDTMDNVYDFFEHYKEKQLFVIARNKRKYIIETGMKNIDMFVVYDATNGQRLHEMVSFSNILCMLFRKTQNKYKEIFWNDTSIFLDELNIEYYLEEAKEIRKQHGQTKIEDMTCTGEEYFDKMEKIIQIAHDLMNGQLVPDLFQRIPLKKNGTFTANRRIPIFKNNLYEAAQYDTHVAKSELVLCVIPQETYEYGEKYDLSEPITEHRARLAITSIQGAKKIYPLIGKNMVINDITTKTTYLKNDQIQPGGIYQEKSGTEYLYLGCINIDDISEYARMYKIPTNKKIFDAILPCHHYIRMTKKIQKMIDQSNSLEKFLKIYIQDKVKKQYDNPNFSERENPRKFVKETATTFVNKTFTNINYSHTKIKDAIPFFSHTVPTYDGETAQQNWYIIQK